MSYGLGVDLGTTYSAAARYRDGVAEMVSLGNRSTIVPSAVLVTREGEFLVGEAALRRGATEPERLAREFKRRIGDSVPLILGGTPQSAEALSARLLRWIVDHVTEQEGAPPDRVALTFPANWGLFKQELLAQVIRLGEVSSAVTLTEPDAAAISYAAAERVAAGEVIAVYDLGGGTFDAAILRKTATGFDLLGEPEGIERRGGIDIDAAVFAHVNRGLDGELDQLPADDPVIVQAVARLRQDCIEAKEALSADTDVSIPVLLPHRSTEVRLTRAELEDMVRPLLDDTIEALRRAIDSANLTTDQINRVLLVGGTSRMPLVGQLLAETLGRPYFVDAHPKYAVALGAARMVGEAWTTAIVPAVRIDAPGPTGLTGAPGPAGYPGPASPPVPPPAPPIPAPAPVPEPPSWTRQPPTPGAPSAPPGPTQTPSPAYPATPAPTQPHEYAAALPLEPTDVAGGFGPPPQERRSEPQRGPDGAARRRQSRRGLGAVAGIVLAALLVVSVVRLTDDGDEGEGGGGDDGGGEADAGDQPPEAPTVALAATIPVGSFADGLTIDGDNLFVSATFAARDGTDDIYRIDLATGVVQDSFVVDGEPIGMLVVDGSLWVARRIAGEVARIDPETGAELTTLEAPGRPADLSFAAGAIWVAAADGILYRIDPSDDTIQVVSNQLPGLSAVLATDDAIYVSYGTSAGIVAAIDPTTFEVVDSVEVTGDLDELELAESGLWVAQRSGNTVSRIDLDTFEITAEVQVGDAPAGIAADGDRIWVINNDGASLTLIDGPSATALTTIPVGTDPLTVVTSPGRVWVSLSSDDAVAQVNVGD